MVGTKGKFAQTYGRFEVRAKYPDVTDLRASTAASGCSRRPQVRPLADARARSTSRSGGRTDPTLVLPSLHYKGRDYHADSGLGLPDLRRQRVPHLRRGVGSRPGSSFFIDGSPCFSRTPVPDSPLVAPQPFDQPFSMILNMGVGMATGTNTVTARDTVPGDVRGRLRQGLG